MALFKSRTFSTFDPNRSGNEQFAADLRSFISLSDAGRRACIAAAVDHALAPTNLHEEQVLEALVGSASDPGPALLAGVSAMHFMLRSLTSEDKPADRPEDLADDLVTLRLLDPTQKAMYIEAIASLKSDIDARVRPSLYQNVASTGLAPVFRGISTTVELRPIRKKPYDSTIDIESYSLVPLGFVGVVSIELRTVQDEINSSLFFQANREQVDRMIVYLRAALKDLDAVESVSPIANR